MIQRQKARRCIALSWSKRLGGRGRDDQLRGNHPAHDAAEAFASPIGAGHRPGRARAGIAEQIAEVNALPRQVMDLPPHDKALRRDDAGDIDPFFRGVLMLWPARATPHARRRSDPHGRRHTW